MNWDRVEGNWKTLKGQVKQQWGRLTDDDLDVIDGKREELLGRIQNAYGMSRDDADRQIREWEKNQTIF
ncbi:MAG TPA: CsbD family protein [Aestuariivirgaceae bacterium]|nr:CsbD family protein [Aestuariivirgaceae bacterium]